jgi:hypothetical protein
MNARFTITGFTLLLLLQINGTADAQVQRGLPSISPSAPPSSQTPSQAPGTTPPKFKDETGTALKSMGAAGITGNKKIPMTSNANTASCWNCGTLMSVTDSRTKAKPVWMNSTNPSDVTESSAQAAEKLADKAGDRPLEKAPEKIPDKAKAGPLVAGGNLSRPDSIGGLHRRLGFEAAVLMDDGSTKTLVLSMRPAYNIGAKVKVVGNSLMPR